jgi:hypothetical protein
MIVETLIIFFFGFPGAFLSLLVSIIGIVQNKYWLVLIGVLLFLPFTYYLYGAPGILSKYVFLLPLLQFSSALAVYKKKRTLAWLLLAPSILMVFWVVSVVLIYSSGNTEGAIN